MRLRKHAAALALCCATAAAHAQNPENKPADKPDNPREVRITERRVDQPDQPTQPPAPRPQNEEEQRVVELYNAQLGGRLTNAAYLGVVTSGVPAALRQHLGLPEGVGLVVDFVEDDSPAKTAGVKQYDILTKMDEQILVNGQQLAVLIRSHKAGDQVKLTLLRGGKEQALTAKLLERPGKPLEDLFIFDQPGDVRPGWNGRLAAPARPQPPRNNRNSNGNNNASSHRAVSVWRDNDMTITIRQESDGRHVKAVDKSGKTMFDGKLRTDDDRNKLPPNVAEKVKQMEGRQQPDAGPRGADPRGSADFGGADVDVRLEGSIDFDGEDVKVEEHDDADDDEKPRPSARRPIHDDDVLNITIAGVHGPDVKTVKLARVRDGRVQLPYVAPVKCVGLTERELEKKVTTLYTDAKIAPAIAVRVRNVGRAEQRAAKEEVPGKN